MTTAMTACQALKEKKTTLPAVSGSKIACTAMKIHLFMSCLGSVRPHPTTSTTNKSHVPRPTPAASGRVLQKLRGHDDDVTSISWCPELTSLLSFEQDHLLVSASKDKTLR